MGSNIGEIRISFVIIAKSHRTTSVFWHNKLFSLVTFAIYALSHALPSSFNLQPRQNGGVNLERVYCPRYVYFELT